MATVIKRFRDKTDNGKTYEKGDSYSHKDEKRIAFLIEKGYLEGNKKANEGFPKHTGGGWYELSNGKKVKGKSEAKKAESELK